MMLQWTNGQPINGVDSTPMSPGSCAFNGLLYVFWKAGDGSNRIFYSASADGVTWPAGRPINNVDTTSQSPYAVPFETYVGGAGIHLYLFWVANDPSNAIYWSYSSDGLSWPPGQRINSTDSTPQPLTLAMGLQVMALYWTANDPSNFIYASYDNLELPTGSPWPAGIRILNATAPGPLPASTATALSACNHNDYLYLFWKGTNYPWPLLSQSNNIYFSSSYDGYNFAPSQVISQTDSTQLAPSACEFNNAIYVFWIYTAWGCFGWLPRFQPFRANSIFYTSSSDGVTWPPGEAINNGASPTSPVSVTAFNGKLYVFWKDDSSNAIYYSTGF